MKWDAKKVVLFMSGAYNIAFGVGFLRWLGQPYVLTVAGVQWSLSSPFPVWPNILDCMVLFVIGSVLLGMVFAK